MNSVGMTKDHKWVSHVLMSVLPLKPSEKIPQQKFALNTDRINQRFPTIAW